MSVVVDASIVIKLLLNEGDMPAARNLIADQEMFAPDLLSYEVANAIWGQVRAKKLARSDADEAISAFEALPISLELSGSLFAAARRMSFAIDTPIYDCAYWALAVRLDMGFLTADAKFAAKLRTAKMAGSRLKLLR